MANDPRIVRTRKLLHEALETLMQTKSFKEISVRDITEAATVNRATFYDHYTDKYALLDAMSAKALSAKLGSRVLVLCEENEWSLGTLEKLARAFGMSLSEFLEGVTL